MKDEENVEKKGRNSTEEDTRKALPLSLSRHAVEQSQNQRKKASTASREKGGREAERKQSTHCLSHRKDTPPQPASSKQQSTINTPQTTTNNQQELSNHPVKTLHSMILATL